MRRSRHDEVENEAKKRGSHAEGMQNGTKKYTQMKTKEGKDERKVPGDCHGS